MSQKRSSKKRKHKGRGAYSSKSVALLVLFCLCIGGISLVSAKYIKQTVINNNTATAQEFYFESDLLDGKEHEVVPTEGEGTTASVTILLKNHVDELRYSETDIEYVVAVKESGNDITNVQINYPKSSDENTGVHIIKGGAISNADVTIAGLQSGKTYTVTAVTSNTYQKTLTGTIKVASPDTKVYAAVSDKVQYIEVTVWTIDYSGAVTLNYSTSLLPDNTDSMMENVKSTDKIIEKNWLANTSHVFRFFKSDVSKNYQVSVSSQEVTVSEKQ